VLDQVQQTKEAPIRNPYFLQTKYHGVRYIVKKLLGFDLFFQNKHFKFRSLYTMMMMMFLYSSHSGDISKITAAVGAHQSINENKYKTQN